MGIINNIFGTIFSGIFIVQNVLMRQKVIGLQLKLMMKERKPNLCKCSYYMHWE